MSLVCFGFALLRSAIGPKNSHHLLNQSITNRIPVGAFSRAFNSFCFCFELSLANDDVNLCAYWLLSLLWFRFFGTHLKTALKEKKRKMAINFHLLRKSRQYPRDLKSTYRS